MAKSLIMPSVAEESIASVKAMAQGPLAFQLPLQGRERCSGNLGTIFGTAFSVEILKLPEILSTLGEQQKKKKVFFMKTCNSSSLLARNASNKDYEGKLDSDNLGTMNRG